MEKNHNDMKVHKLRFASRADFDAANITTTLPYVRAISIVGETGLIHNPTEYDEEGNPLPVTFIDGFHVDIMTTEVIQEWKEFTVTGEHHWYHSFGYGEVVKEEDFILKPTDSWLKADIQAYLTANGIEWTTSMTKAQLLELCG